MDGYAPSGDTIDAESQTDKEFKVRVSEAAGKASKTLNDRLKLFLEGYTTNRLKELNRLAQIKMSEQHL